MTSDLVLVLAVLLVDLALFVHGRLRRDLVALLTLVFLAVTGVVTPTNPGTECLPPDFRG